MLIISLAGRTSHCWSYQSLLVDFCGQVVDYHVNWQSASAKLEIHTEFLHYVELFGLARAERLYKQHIVRLREEFIARQQNMYLHRLDAVLHKLLPDLASVADRYVVSWHVCKHC